MAKQQYSVYMEGYADNGGCTGASYVGEGTGETFAEAAREACVQRFGESETQKYFSAKGSRPSFWGCRLFDNYDDAAKFLG